MPEALAVQWLRTAAWRRWRAWVRAAVEWQASAFCWWNFTCGRDKSAMETESMDTVDVSKQTWCLTSTETIRLIRDGENGGKGVWRCEKRERIDLSLHCHHQNDLH